MTFVKKVQYLFNSVFEFAGFLQQLLTHQCCWHGEMMLERCFHYLVPSTSAGCQSTILIFRYTPTLLFGFKAEGRDILKEFK
jgi:hypothetical protein